MLAPAALLWLIGGLGVLGLLAAGVDLDGLMAAGLAALALSLLSALLPLAPGLQIAAFAAITVGLLLGLQRWSAQRRQRSIAPAATASTAQVLSGFTAPNPASGRVLWKGQSWAAENLEPSRTLRSGEAVVVMGREGTQLQIMEPHEPAEWQHNRDARRQDSASPPRFS